MEAVHSYPNDEESPVYSHLKNPSLVDFPGHLAGVFFVSGCNYKCGFCHNAELMAKKQKGLRWSHLRGTCDAFLNDWVTGAVITGGEPTLNLDLEKLIHFLRAYGWAIKLDTNGSMPEVVQRCLPLVDYVAMDIKAGPDGYEALVGYSKMDRIKASIQAIKNSGKDYEFRTTIIEGFHDEHQMRGIGELIQGAKRYILQPFVPQDVLPSKKLRKTPRTSTGTLDQVRRWVSDTAEDIIVRGA